MYILSLFAAKLNGQDVNLPNTSDGNTIASGILTVVWIVLGMVAVIMIIIGGYQFLTSAGKPEQASKARNTLLFAVIGLVLAISAFAISNFVLDRL